MTLRAALLAVAVALTAGCGMGPYSPRFVSLSLQVGVTGGEARHVLATPVSTILVGRVAKVEVRLQDVALAPESASLAVLPSFNAATATVTFANLEQGHRYKVWCAAFGTDPNAADPGDPTANLTDPDARLSTAYIDVPLAATGAGQDVAARLVDEAGVTVPDGKLPLRLYSPAYSGGGTSLVTVTGGGATNSTHDVSAQ